MIGKCDFSLGHYFEVLDKAKNSYDFIGPLKDFQKLKKKNNFIVLRHDVDISLEHALKIAQLESDHNLHSTFFILLNSQFYNALTKNNVVIIKKISKLGHEIGLHYDTDILPKSISDARLHIGNQIKILEDVSGQKITSITQHNPTTSKKLNQKLIVNFFDAMHNPIMKSAVYLSDSVHNWRKGCMCNHVGKISKLQILTHPIWWHEISMSLDNILKKICECQKTDVTLEFKALEKLYTNYILNIKNDAN